MSIAATTDRAVGRRLVTACLGERFGAAAFLALALRGAVFDLVFGATVFCGFALDTFVPADFLAVGLLFADFVAATASFFTADLDCFVFFELTFLAGVLVDFAADFADLDFVVALAGDFWVDFDDFVFAGDLALLRADLDWVFLWPLDLLLEPPAAETSDFVSGSLGAFCVSAGSVI